MDSFTSDAVEDNKDNNDNNLYIKWNDTENKSFDDVE